ncbi:MAG: adenylyl-sulfate kinase [Spirochaetes bacterium]|nr:adenylyl-sulfate kinase [Spirochaetota bacterium]
MKENRNIHVSEGFVSYLDRCRLLNQNGLVLWMTGLSGSGKSTIAVNVEKRLFDKNKAVYRLDGDNIRTGLNSDLGFTENDRNENIRRVIEAAKLFKDAGIITIVSFISPYKKMREQAKLKIGAGCFFEIYIKASLEICKKRDPKGLYKKAINKKISNFTGITDIYEEPEEPDLIIDTDLLSVNESVEKIMEFILDKIKFS